MGERDEAAYPEEQLAEQLDRVLKGSGAKLQFRDRKGRSEKLTLVFPEGGTITISANTRKPGESRRALVAFVERCEEIGRQVARDRGHG